MSARVTQVGGVRGLRLLRVLAVAHRVAPGGRLRAAVLTLQLASLVQVRDRDGDTTCTDSEPN